MKNLIKIFLLSVISVLATTSCQKEDPIDYATVLSGNWQGNEVTDATEGINSKVTLYLRTNFTYNYTITINDGDEPVTLKITGNWEIDPTTGTINFHVSDNEDTAIESGIINLAENSITINGQLFRKS